MLYKAIYRQYKALLIEYLHSLFSTSVFCFYLFCLGKHHGASVRADLHLAQWTGRDRQQNRNMNKQGEGGQQTATRMNRNKKKMDSDKLQ